MRENQVLTNWRAERPVINGWLAIPSSVSAEIMAQQPWDSLTVDLQHGLIDYSQALPMLQAISTTAIPPMARVPWLEPGIIMKLLDAGAYGIICPMINTRADAEALVAACRYAPLGSRSVGPMRAIMYGGADYIQHANDTIVVLAMIETKQGLQNLEAIVTTPGLTGVYVGPGDLSLSLGYPPRLDPVEPEVVTAITKILKVTKAAGLRAGIHCGAPEYAATMINDGFDLVSMSTEANLLSAAANAALAATRQAIER